MLHVTFSRNAALPHPARRHHDLACLRCQRKGLGTMNLNVNPGLSLVVSQRSELAPERKMPACVSGICIAIRTTALWNTSALDSHSLDAEKDPPPLANKVVSSTSTTSWSSRYLRFRNFAPTPLQHRLTCPLSPAPPIHLSVRLSFVREHDSKSCCWPCDLGPCAGI